eukprot:COSAG02_NODE_32846_length_509_cov_1.251220_2_plen_133_part_01
MTVQGAHIADSKLLHCLFLLSRWFLKCYVCYCPCRYWADVARATIAAAERRAAEAEAKTAAAEARAKEAEAAERRAARTWHEQDNVGAVKPAGASRSAAAPPPAAGNKDKGSPVHRLLEAVYARKQAASAATG